MTYRFTWVNEICRYNMLVRLLDKWMIFQKTRRIVISIWYLQQQMHLAVFGIICIHTFNVAICQRVKDLILTLILSKHFKYYKCMDFINICR